LGHDVASALIAAHGLAPPVQVGVVVDCTDQAARLGYGHFDAIAELARAGEEVRLAPACGWAPWSSTISGGALPRLDF
jgi:hypothetical protein